ncbi:MAG TPA: ABC transporter substrate-binding protein [Alphaproteobacteria bacterium]|nr:ABC transporter substrate-binding protein [Alphaproteobacteria bacterium]USO05341.1 MAG: ABC transporter substrate-binding protein [Rhodospirillales bacterium]HOO81236.1 ABC transporter substrate-binding protein [Alphaproteobacteria bacterium]
MQRRFLFSSVLALGLVSGIASHASLLSTSAAPVLNSRFAHFVAANAHGDEVALAAEKFVAALADQGIGFLSDKKITEEKRRAEFKALLNKNFDMNTIARFSLGRYWRSATQAQRDEYVVLFKKMIVDVYSARFSDYQGQEIEVVGSRKEGERDILVHSLLRQDGGPDVKVDWRVRNRSGAYQVIDVIVEGVSMAMTQRSDFSSVVQRGGGDVEALLVHLRQE